MRDIVLKHLNRLQKEKEDNRIEPTHILAPSLYNSIHKEIRDTLNELYYDKKIEVSGNVNGTTIKIKRDNDE